MSTSFSSTRMYGYVSERDSSSRISASQTTFDFDCVAPFATTSSPRYPARPPFFEIDFDVITDDVFGATWTALPPASWCWPSPAKAIESTSPCAPSPMSQIDGYFMVSFDPRFPSTHSIVVLRQRPPGLTTISTTAEWSESVV